MRMNWTIISTLIVLCCISVYAQTPASGAVTRFTASVAYYNDPSVSGTLSGSYYYAFGNATEVTRRTTYAVGPSEIYKYSRGSANRYLMCSGTCETETYSGAIEFPFRLTSDSSIASISYDGRTCNGWARSGTGNSDTSITRVYIDSNNYLCRLTFASGKTADFTAFTPNVGAEAFTVASNCPQPVCNQQMDVIISLDISGSISRVNFEVMRNFSLSLANSFNIGPDAVRIGFNFWDSVSYRILEISNSRVTVLNTISSWTRPSSGSTCITCGIQTSLAQMPTSRNGQQVTKVIILMTDGAANVNNINMYPAAANATARDVSIFSIGVGSVNINQLRNISSKIEGVQTVYTVAGFSALGDLLNGDFVSSTCQTLPGSTCGANCRGFCSCGRTCLCPDNCNDGDACTDDFCTIGQNGNGCQNRQISCTDNNLCTIDTCNPSSGCVFTNVSAGYCNDNNPCTNDICVPGNIGCQYPPKDCSSGNPCSTDTCNANTGVCEHVVSPSCTCASTVCPFINNCTTNICNPTTGSCQQRPVNCDDGNICTVDTCNNQLGCQYAPLNCSDNDLCTVDTCDSRVEGGCVRTPINESEYDDQNACTIDSCSPSRGITHTNVTCVDGDACTADTCQSITGCVYTEYDCGEVLGSAVATRCDIALCNSTGEGCYVGQSQGAQYDECGECFGKGLNCVSKVTIGIGAGVISAIVIGSLAVGGAIFAGSFGGVKAYQKYRANMQGAQSNPMYQEKTAGAGINPMYTDQNLLNAT